ncbi:MAG: hypothetical protein J6Y08_10585 [Clostridiales bacterium]|nr:hypothetical protein [Clostridiales bacterium]
MSETKEKVIAAEVSAEDLAKLPKDTVHCFPASKTQILRRRIITLVIIALVGAAMGYLLSGKTDPGILLWLVSSAIVVVCAVVFIHTFVIAKYRVAMDYQKNEVVLRYMFSKITIPFDSFDARDGEPDRATAIIKNSSLGANMAKVGYLILDNVYEEVCYQTSSKDLATQEDFDLLCKEAKQVASVYKAKEKYDALKTDDDDTAKPESKAEDDISALVNDVMAEEKTAKEEAEAAVKEEAKAELEEAKEAVEDAVSEVKEAVEESKDSQD